MLKKTDLDIRHSLNESGWVKVCREECERRRCSGYETRREPKSPLYNEDTFEQQLINQRDPLTSDGVCPKDVSFSFDAPVRQSLTHNYELESSAEKPVRQACVNYTKAPSSLSAERLKELEQMDYGPGFHALRPPDRPHIRCVEPLGPPRRYSREVAPETFFYASAKHGGQHRGLTEFLRDDSVDEEYKKDMLLLFGCLERFANDPTYLERKRWEPKMLVGGAQLYDCPEERKAKLRSVQERANRRTRSDSRQEQRSIRETVSREDKANGLRGKEPLDSLKEQRNRAKNFFVNTYKEYDCSRDIDVDTSVFGEPHLYRKNSISFESPQKPSPELTREEREIMHRKMGYEPPGTLTVRRISQTDPGFGGFRNDLEKDCVYTYGGIDGPSRPLREAMTDSRVTKKQREQIMAEYPYLRNAKG